MNKMKLENINTNVFDYEIKNIRNLSYDNAKREIKNYLSTTGNRKVYVSEIAEKLVLDIELIQKVINDLQFNHD